jgi:hypothetical protein
MSSGWKLSPLSPLQSLLPPTGTLQPGADATGSDWDETLLSGRQQGGVDGLIP